MLKKLDSVISGEKVIKFLNLGDIEPLINEISLEENKINQNRKIKTINLKILLIGKQREIITQFH